MTPRVPAELPQPGIAAYSYYCQQAAEKLLKGFLVLAGTDFRKSHDLDQLGDAVLSAVPAEAPLVNPALGWTSWGTAYRYPDAAAPAPEPSAEELAVAPEQTARQISALAVKLRAQTAGGNPRTSTDP
jgi:HEPN domain-containing protein